ncbi:serine hydrolase domain-containing protein [Pseudohongiella sp.]|uniref:Beta-lactamase-related domain-containing protein n=1 Tax=marine sediment metagenome TaxID=412755 RepID=A0A0F9YKD0_9ZZZZ|nr:serine hydrolase domain-containing protein [Pseudohongiella sp.]HDZ08207.1 class A beta-lactamase-related serine hydrolase [Pseudohongiella sp.]HEA63175.1 class A beta-lactamase-related serine hydrolase [Pseudohongiella sp.]
MRLSCLPKIHAFAIAGIFTLSAISAQAQPIERGDPGAVGLSVEKLTLATQALQARVDAGDIAGAVAAIVRDGQLVYAEALGLRDIDAGAAMPFDALFRTYSMTRPVTALGILMLHDEGLLDVNDSVQTYLPQFAEQQVLVDADATDVSATRPRQGDMTLAMLLTHTSGLGSRNSALYRGHNVHSYDQSLAQVVDNVAALPLFEDPGTGYRYGLHAEVLGRVIEVVSGQDIQTFFRQRIFDPLGMSDTVFYVDPSLAERLATVYRADASGRLQAHEMEAIPVTEPRALASSGVGLVSSTMDFLRFSQLFLDNGRVNGQQLVSPAVVSMMAENAVPDALLPIGSRGYWLGSGWSLGGMAVVMDADTYNHNVNEGEYWWDGSAGTRFWIDPHENMVTIIMAQVSPASGNGFREQFKTLVYDAIE